MNTAKSFINPEIAALIDAKNEVQALMEQTKQAELQLTERENLVIEELEMLTKKMDDFQIESKKLRRMLTILSWAVAASFLFSTAMIFVK